MKKEEIIVFVIIVITAFSLGWTLHSQEIKYVSQQKTICEAKGGKYSFRPKYIGDGYVESCSIPEKEIEL